ncbi:MAG TPA: hypothetical protein VN493_18600 [Thermoanaerobaculia bacterium]|nr:hypothetical protein [Thermoanaerobaculia bacterium]
MNVKDAVKIAYDYVKDFYQDHTLSLEEVELSEDGRFWYVTLGVTNPLEQWSSGRKDYKVVTVDIQTGQVKSMKLREA